MPVRVYYNNQPCTIRPTPLVSIGTNILKDGAGEAFGVTYSITLTGTILADQGMPFGLKTNGYLYDFIDDENYGGDGPYGAFDVSISHFDQSANGGKPPRQKISEIEASNSIFSKQKILRALFSKDGQPLEITDFNDDESTIICYPRLIDINFTEGIYVDRCDFTINLECDTLLNKDLKIDYEGADLRTEANLTNLISEQDLINVLKSSFISDYSEDWAIEVDENIGETMGLPYNPSLPSTALDDNPKTYRITHNVNAVGKTHFGPNGKIPAWESAKQFVQNKIYDTPYNYPNLTNLLIGSGALNLLTSLYNGYNLVRTEQVSESNGSYSVSETWLLATGIAYENYNVSISKSIDNPFYAVSIDGNIKGLTSISPSGYAGGLSSLELLTENTAYANALIKYAELTANGTFTLNCPVYTRANNAVPALLNPKPRSISLGTNEYTGEITYNLQYDNRPLDIISGVLAESITVNDTYPGDVFSVIPVIGRLNGPVLQYIGGRTEYKRDLSINLTMDYTRVPYGTGRNPLLLAKPSIVEPTASQIANLITELSPAREPGVRKYFISPPSENWNPKEGTYSLNISWTYELDK